MLYTPRPCDGGPLVLEGELIGVLEDEFSGVGPMEVREAEWYYLGLSVYYFVKLIQTDAIQVRPHPLPPPLAVQS